MSRVSSEIQALDRIEELSRELYELRKQLAGCAAQEELPKGRFAILACRVGAERIGLLQGKVDEVVQFATLTPLPEAPPWVVGVLNLRGESLPVLDAVARLSRRPRTPDAGDFIIICREGERRFGLVVQEIYDLAGCSQEELRPPPADLPHAPYLLGIVYQEPRPVLLFSLVALLNSSDVPQVRDELLG